MSARRTKAPAQPARIYVPPKFDRRQRAALSVYLRAKRSKTAPSADPLEMRLGLRCLCIENRAGFVVSNPGLDDVLRRNPTLDDSRGGVAWLRKVYVWQRELVALPSARAAVDQRRAAARPLSSIHLGPAPMPATRQVQQLGLFA